MKRFLFLLIALFFSMSVLAACSSESDKKGKTESTNGEIEKQPGTSGDAQVSSENKQEEDSEDSKKNQEADTSSGNFNDQTDLKIGDTGQAESTTGKYEITVNSVQMKDEINGKVSSIDHLFLFEVTVKNIGDSTVDALERIGTLEFSNDPESGGRAEYTKSYQLSNPLTGTLEQGQSVTGEVVFQGFDSETYYIRTDIGLIGAGAVKNKTTWTFNKSEAQ